MKLIVGEQLRGYDDTGLYMSHAAEYARGKWTAILDDDMEFEGRPWDEALLEIESPAFVVCEKYHLGPSFYDQGSCDFGIGWFVPNKCWKSYGHEQIGFPPDTWMKELLVDKNKWPLKRLQGVTLYHNWQRPYDRNR